MLYEDPESGEESSYMFLLDQFAPLLQKITQFLKSPQNNDSKSVLSFHGSPLELMNLHHVSIIIEIQQFLINIISALFVTEIDKKVKMDFYKTSKQTPRPLNVQDLILIEKELIFIITNSLSHFMTHGTLLNLQGKTPTVNTPTATETAIKKNGDSTNNTPLTMIGRPSFQLNSDRNIWTIPECILELASTMWDLLLLSSTADTSTSTSAGITIGQHVFDKDEDLSMRFVCAASNLRSHIFHIGEYLLALS